MKGEEEHLPADAQLKGSEDVLVQDRAFRPDTLGFRQEKDDSPSHARTDLAALPPGNSGQFGPGVRAGVVTPSSADGMSEPTILDFVQTVGLSISAGPLSDLLITDQEPSHAESAAVVKAGQARSPWQHLDSTGTRVHGTHKSCHLLCNP